MNVGPGVCSKHREGQMPQAQNSNMVKKKASVALNCIQLKCES